MAASTRDSRWHRPVDGSGSHHRQEPAERHAKAIAMGDSDALKGSATSDGCRQPAGPGLHRHDGHRQRPLNRPVTTGDSQAQYGRSRPGRSIPTPFRLGRNQPWQLRWGARRRRRQAHRHQFIHRQHRLELGQYRYRLRHPGGGGAGDRHAADRERQGPARLPRRHAARWRGDRRLRDAGPAPRSARSRPTLRRRRPDSRPAMWSSRSTALRWSRATR